MKKKLLYLLLFFTTWIADAQIVNIPDANFKNKLLSATTSNSIAKDSDGNSIVIDTNGDLEIQESEALLVYYLDVNISNISDLAGLDLFSNIEEFWCYGNQISTLDLTSMINLRRLECEYNNLNNINLTGLVNLKILNLRQNELTNIDLSGLIALEELNCNHNALNSVDFTGLTNLKSLQLDYNNFISLDISMLSSLEYFSAVFNQLTNLNFIGLSNLTSIDCSVNQLTSLDFNGLVSLQSFSCSNNQLTSLDFTPSINLKNITCINNQLVYLDVNNLQNLISLDLSSNSFSTLDIIDLPSLEMLYLYNVPLEMLIISNVPALEYITCTYSLLSHLDLSDCSGLMWLACMNNDFLETINLKNGSILSSLETSIVNNPNLNFICIDENEETVLEEVFGDELPSYSSYCSFTPGGDYNSITGTVIFDSENDGCENNVPHHFLKIHITDGVNEGYSFTNNNGEYMFYVGAGNYTITPEFENDWFVSSPLGQDINFPAVDGSVYTQDFCITGNGEVHEDIEVIMVPVGAARPGFPADYKIVYRNKGNQVLSGNVSCTWDYSILNEADVIPVPDIVVPGSYTWNFTNLLPFEDREIVMTLNVNAPTDEPPVNANDVLDFVATAALAGTDEIPEDNAYELNQVVVNSYDPNIITCIEGGTESSEAIGEYLHYVVDFENTGSAAASFVVVKHDINPAQFDISSLQVLNSSHQVEARINGNRLEFIFQDINLAAADHGNILFRLKSLETLQAGDTVMNTANIYFDYNYPIETNEATTLFEELVNGLDEFDIDRSVTIYPNPAENILNIEAKGAIKTIELYDIQARLLQTAEVNGTGVRFDISARAPGVYFLKITMFEGVKVEKVIKK